MKDTARKYAGWWMPLVIIVAAVSLRCVYLAEIKINPEFSHPIYDPEYNAYWARGLATGDWTVPAGVPDPEIRTTPHGRPPGYPWFLAAVYTVFGVNDYAPRIIQMIIGVLNALLLYGFGKKLFGSVAGFFAGLFMAIYWAFPYFEGLLTYPSVAVFMLLLMLHAILKWHDSMQLRWLFTAGAALGIFALFRPNGLLMAPVLVLWIVWVLWKARGGVRKMMISAAVFLLSSALLLAPAFMRNYIVAGDTVFISSYGGINLYVGNHPEASLVEPRIPELIEIAGIEHWSCFDYPSIVRGLAASQGRESMAFSEANRYFYQKAFAFIRSNPGLFLENMLKKTLLFLGPHEITNDTVMEYDKRFSRTLHYLPGFAWVLALFIFGVLIFLIETPQRIREGDKRAQALGTLLLLLIVSYSISVIIYFVAGRYRAPVLPLMMIFAAYGSARLILFIKQRRFAAAGAGVIVLALMALAAHANITGYVPTEGTWHLRRAMAYGACGNDREACDAYRLALEHGAESSVIYANLGRLHIDNGEVQQGLDMYNKGLEQNPNNSIIRNNLGYELHKLGYLDAAIAHLERAVAVNPSFVLARMNLGNALADKGDFSVALAQFEEAMRLNPKDPAAAYNVGRMLFAGTNYEGAIAAYCKSLELSPHFVLALNNLGYCYAVQEQYQQALPFYERAIEADPGFILAYHNLGNALFALGQVAEARSTFARALQLDESNLYTLYNLGRACMGAKALEEALDFLKKALEINPEFVPALVQLGELYIEQGKAGEAVTVLEQAEALSPEDSKIKETLARARFSAGTNALQPQPE